MPDWVALTTWVDDDAPNMLYEEDGVYWFEPEWIPSGNFSDLLPEGVHVAACPCCGQRFVGGVRFPSMEVYTAEQNRDWHFDGGICRPE